MSCKEVEYRKLGEFISQRREKNDGFDVPIRGVSKEGFIDPKQQDADTSIYNVFYKNDFVFNPARMELNSIALNQDLEKGICSSLYEIFYIKDTNVLDPVYLNMLLKHEHFIRFCAFKGWGSVREYFRVNEIREYLIPVIPIVEQKRIVDQYNAIQKRIENNKQTIAKLEETAQAIYRKMFVDDIDPENLPEGWTSQTIEDVANVSAGGDRPVDYSETKRLNFTVPIYSNGTENFGLYGYTTVAKINDPSVTVSARGTIGFVCFREEPYVPIVRLLVFIPKKKIAKSAIYLFYLLKNMRLEGDGAVQLQLTAPKMKEIPVIVPSQKQINEFSNLVSKIFLHINKLRKENDFLIQFFE